MTAVECPRSLQTIFPSSTGGSPASGRRTTGYKKIRWRKYDPSKKSLNTATDQFVQWQPPASFQDEDLEEHQDQHKSKKSTDPPPAKEAKRISPVEPLPLNGTRVNPFLELP